MDTGTATVDMGTVLVTKMARTLTATVDLERAESVPAIKRRSKIGDATTAETVEILSRCP